MPFANPNSSYRLVHVHATLAAASIVVVAAACRSPEPAQNVEGYWTGFLARIRVIAYNTTLVSPEEAPRSVFDLADSKWKGQVAMADPRFGSTSFHVAALYAQLGDAKADEFFRRLKANQVRVVDSNSVVRDLVVRGEVKVGLTDTDDVNCSTSPSPASIPTCARRSAPSSRHCSGRSR